MATSTYVPIATTTLASSASSVSFFGIPTQDVNGNALKDLRIIAAGAVNTNQNAFVYLNNDTTESNYLRIEMGSDGTTPFYGNVATAKFMSFTATGQSVNTLDLFDYSQTNKYKSIFTRISSATAIAANAGRWANTSAVTSIKIQAQVGTFNAGMIFSIYGIAG